MSHKKSLRAGEKGNVLFLILIAVALFAALSYAVTQSTRSGSNDTSREQSLISSAQLTQYPAGVRTSLIRMVIGGIAADDLYFNSPSDFGSGQPIDDTDADTTDETRAVFHPAGGGAPFQFATPDLLSTNAQGAWVFSGMYEIDRIGTMDAGAGGAGNDLIAFLPNVSRAICERINDELGISGGTDGDGDGIPSGNATTLPTVDDHAMTIDAASGGGPGFVGAEVARIGSGAGSAFSGQPFGCYDADDADATTSSPNVYYHVLIER